MRAAAFISRALEKLKRAHSDIRSRIWIANAMRISGHVKSHPKKSNEYGLPEADHLHITNKRKVIKSARFRKSHGAAEGIGLKSHVGVGKEQPVAGGGFISLLESVWFP